MKTTLTSLIIIIALKGFCQLPNTDIWLLDIKTINNNTFITNPVNITNRNGYDNQPAFSADGNYILYTSGRDEKQTDIFKYDIKSKTTSQVTNTATSEYSSSFTPDGNYFSVIMVEPDSTQRLWKFPINGGTPTVVLKNIDSVGYQCWIDKNTIAVTIITNPMTLFVYDINTEKVLFHTDSVGRCMKKINDKTMLFTHLKSGKRSQLTELDLTTFKEKKILCSDALTLQGSEDFAFSGAIFMASNQKIYSLPCSASQWQELINLFAYKITNITRLAISPDGTKMAIVAEQK